VDLELKHPYDSLFERISCVEGKSMASDGFGADRLCRKRL
jgi:hypothetical protein